MINETAKSTVILDGKQAENELKKLEDASKGYREAMEKCRKANDLAGFEKLKKEVDANSKAQAALRKELFSVEKVMQNLSGSSMNQLKAAQRGITSELNKMTRGTQEYIDKSKQLKQVNAEIGKVKTEMQGAGGAGQSAWGKIGMAATKFMGIAAAAWGVIKSGQAIIESTSSLSDKFAVALGGVKSGFHSIMQAVATMDFTNFWSNTKKAIDTGKEIAWMKDELEDRKRAETVIESKYKYEIAALKVVAATQTNSDAVRQKALQDAITKEKELNEYKLDNAQLDFDINMKNMLLETKLAQIKEGATEEEKKQAEDLAKIKLANFFMEFKHDEALRKQAEKFNELYDYFSSKKNSSTEDLLNKKKEWDEIFGEKNIDQIRTYASILKSYGKAADTTIDEFVQSFGQLYNTKEEYEANVLRLTKQETSFEKKEGKIQLKDKQEMLQMLLDETEKAYNQRRLNIIKFQQKYNIDAESSSQALLANEIAFLKVKEAAIRDLGQDTTTLQIDIANKEIDLNNKIVQSRDRANEKKKQTDQEYYDVQSLLIKQQEQDLQDQIDKENELNNVTLENRKIQAEQGRNIVENLASSTGTALGQLIADQTMTHEQFAETMVLIALDALHAMVRIAIAQIWAGAMASPTSIATWGAAGIAKAMLLTGFVEVAFAAAKAIISSGMKQRYSGKYDVIGAEDGRSYSVGYGGSMSTGVYSTPTLVAERGDEIVIDGATTKNLMVNFPNVLPTIMAAKVPQRANGNNMKSSFQSINSNAKLEALIERQLVVTEQQSLVINALTNRLNKGINAKMNYTHLKEGLAKGQAAEDRASRNN